MQPCDKMPISAVAVASALDAVRGAVVTKKLTQVQEGVKEFTPPKTGLGKLIGKISGRTEAYQIQTEMKKESLSNSAIQAGIPVSGALQFGQASQKMAWLPFAIVAAVVLYFFSPTKRKRR